MKYLDLTLPTPAENLALEEALLEDCDAHDGPEVLRLWEPSSPMVVLGYANQAALETHLPACQSLHVPVLRRLSGGGAVVQAPGTLCYAVILRLDRHPVLASIPGSNHYVLSRIAQAVHQATQLPVERQGDTDLALHNRKIAGHAQRRLAHALLFHGSLLVHLDFTWIDQCLPPPSRQPSYRANRPHQDFLANLHVPMSPLRQALRQTWQAHDRLPTYPAERTATLVAEKYTQPDWNLRR